MLAQGFLRVKGQAQNHKILLFVSWRNKYAIIEWPLFDAPTSTHGVFTSFSLSQYCCLHFWKNKVGSMLAQGFLRVKSQAKITKCYFLWVRAINMQSLSTRHLMRQQVPMVFLLPLVYLGAVAYIAVEISLGSCWRRDISRVKGQILFTNCNFLWLCVICNHQVATTRCVIKYPYFKGQRSRINHKLQLFVNMQSLSGNYSMRHWVPTVF